MKPEEAVEGRTTVRIIMRHLSIHVIAWTISGYTLLLMAIVEYRIKGHQEPNLTYAIVYFLSAILNFAYLLFAIAVATILFRRLQVAETVMGEDGESAASGLKSDNRGGVPLAD